MGEPEVATEDQSQTLLLQLLSPAGKVEGTELVKVGLHRLVLQQYYDAIQPEIKNLVGWKPLGEFQYPVPYREASSDDVKKARKVNDKWLKLLGEAGLEAERAIQLFDGEVLRMGAPDYRLYLLRDGRLLHYAGGFYGYEYHRHAITCGDPLVVLDAISGGGSATMFYPSYLGFVVIMRSLGEALETAIKQRQKALDEQRGLHSQLAQIIAHIR